MTKLPKELTEWLHQFGIDQKSLARVRFGGVIDKQALIGVFGVLGLAYIASRATGSLLWGTLVAMFVVIIVVVVAMGIHGHNHPLEATLEGGEVVVMQHLRQEVAAKGASAVLASLPIPEGIGPKSLSNETNAMGDSN
jgi:hypothetical protein